MPNFNQLRPTIAPSLPIAQSDYSQQSEDQYSNVLRLYFNQLDNFTSALTNSNGGALFTFPHIAASDTTDQYAGGDNTPTLVLWNTTDSINGFTLDPSGYAEAQYSGVYKIDYSLQFANTDNSQHDVAVWLRVNNVDVPRSATKFSIPARKSAGVYTFVVAYSLVEFTINAGDQIKLYWATDKAYNTTGPVNGIYMEYEAAQVSPYAHPSVPSAIGSINFVSAL